MKKFYVTTPIYYVNDRPHIGHAYATFAADILARYHRMLGDETIFLTGTDENAEKNVEAAKKNNEQDVQDYVDRMSAVWQITWDELGVSNDDFIRTTENRHIQGVKKFWEKVYESGDIYKGKYEGLYCIGCEAFYVQSDLTEDELCPIHKRKPEVLAEENYFFKLSKYRGKLLSHIEKNPEFIQPETRRHEVINYISDHLNDVSISRANKQWGIKVPNDNTQTIYVWFDALINYLTAVGYGTNDGYFNKYWPAEIHLVGKDIIKFHCALWPAMLMSAGVDLPKKVFAHGFFTIDGQKISKSLGKTIDPRDLVETYGVDTLRYFLMREIPFGGDGDFSIERLSSRYDSDLANGLGNYISRVIALASDQNQLVIGQDFKSIVEKTWAVYDKSMNSCEFHMVLEAIWRLLSVGDRYIEEKKPWVLKKDQSRSQELNEVLGTLVESVRQIGWMLIPFMPNTALKIFEALGYSEETTRDFSEARIWGSQNSQPKINKLTPIFPRLTI